MHNNLFILINIKLNKKIIVYHYAFNYQLPPLKINFSNVSILMKISKNSSIRYTVFYLCI